VSFGFEGPAFIYLIVKQVILSKTTALTMPKGNQKVFRTRSTT